MTVFSVWTVCFGQTAVRALNFDLSSFLRAAVLLPGGTRRLLCNQCTFGYIRQQLHHISCGKCDRVRHLSFDGLLLRTPHLQHGI